MSSKSRDLVHIKYILLITYVLALLLEGCSSTPDSDRQFMGDPLELLILDIDLPPGWELWRLNQESFPQGRGEYLIAVYKKPQPDRFGTNDLITHNITMFDQLEDAKSAVEADYQRRLKSTTERAEREGLTQENFDPRQNTPIVVR